ncbi:hypothetical protein AZE42_09334, partial [Rhizopogon vesiculosus]
SSGTHHSLTLLSSSTSRPH